MPCRDYPDSDFSNNNEIKRLQNEISMLDSLLCSSCRVLQSYGFDFDTNPRLSEWWHRHLVKDEAKEKERIKKELQKKIAFELTKKPVNELTKEDIELLKQEGYL